VAFNGKVQIDSEEKGKLVIIIMKALRFIQMGAQTLLFSFFKRRTFTEYSVTKHIIFIHKINEICSTLTIVACCIIQQSILYK
jgi:hypothetical protein